MFDTFLGLPLHPLAVHAPVVLLPLLLLTSLAYALVPRVRGYVGWAAILLAVVAPISAVVGVQSGNAYRQGLYGPQELPADNPVEVHAAFGNLLVWWSIGFGVVTLALVLLHRWGGATAPVRKWGAWVLTAGLVVLAVVVAYYLFQVGHSGSEMTHGHRLPG